MKTQRPQQEAQLTSCTSRSSCLPCGSTSERLEVTKKTGVGYGGISHIQSNLHSIESNDTLRLGDLAKEYVSPMNSEPRFKQNLENIFLPHGSSASHMLVQDAWIAKN